MASGDMPRRPPPFENVKTGGASGACSDGFRSTFGMQSIGL